MNKLFLIPLMLLATLMLTAACSEDEPLTDGQEQVIPCPLLLPYRQYRADGADHPVHIGLRYDSGRAGNALRG